MAGRVNYRDDIAGLTAWFTSPFIPVAVGILFAWLVQQGFLSWQWWGTWVLAAITMSALLAVQRPLYQALVEVPARGGARRQRGRPISTTGCFGGLWVYGVCVILGAVAFWQSGLGGAVIAVVLTPLLSIGLALLLTIVNRSKKER